MLITDCKTLQHHMLNKLYDEAKEQVTLAELSVTQMEEKIKNSEQMKAELHQQFDDMKTWSDMYDECDLASKKMILSRLMKSVKVKRDYEIEIDLAIDYQQLGVSNPEDSTSGGSGEKSIDFDEVATPESA